MFGVGGIDETRMYLDNTPSTPEQIAGMKIVARSEHTLRFTCQNFGEEISLRVSEEMNAFYEANIDNVNAQPAFTDQSNLMNGEWLPLTAFAEGNYIFDIKFTRNNDYNIYRFNLTIDNTPPDLQVGVPTQNETGDWVISGVTEPNAEIYFNGKDITSTASNGIFSVPVTEDLSHINFMAIDEAGNKTIATALLNGLASLPENDTTTAIRINLDRTEILTGTTLAATAEVERGGVFVTPEANTIKWIVTQGGLFAKIDTITGVITGLAEGEAIIQASYLGVLKEIAFVTIADQFTINDLQVSEVTSQTSVKLSFTEPRNATNKALEYSVAEPIEGEINTGWASVSATFDGNGNAVVSGLPADKTIYFRMYVTGGINEGFSNKAGRLWQVLNTVSVTFNPQNGNAPTTQEVVVGNLLAEPEEPIRNGYDFQGWCILQSNCVVFWNFYEDRIMNNLTLYANWEDGSGIDEVRMEEYKVILFPNPATNSITLSGLQGGEIIIISDIRGQNLLTRKAANNSEILSISHLSQGMYLVRIVREGTNSVLKLVVK